MKEIKTYESITELVRELKQIKENYYYEHSVPSHFPIHPVRVGDKIGFVDWENGELECVPIFDDFDMDFTSYQDCICVRQNNKWGVLNAYFRYELPVEYPYFVANQVCRIVKAREAKEKAVNQGGNYLSVS